MAENYRVRLDKEVSGIDVDLDIRLEEFALENADAVEVLIAQATRRVMNMIRSTQFDSLPVTSNKETKPNG